MSYFYPLMVNLTGKQVVIIGGGRIALRKAQGLAETGASIVIVSPQILPQLQALANVQWRQKSFSAEDIQQATLIFAATDKPAVNQAVAQAVQPWQWFNDVSDSRNSTFYNTAVVQSNGITLAISTQGQNPSRAKQLKSQLAEFLHNSPTD